MVIVVVYFLGFYLPTNHAEGKRSKEITQVLHRCPWNEVSWLAYISCVIFIRGPISDNHPLFQFKYLILLAFNLIYQIVKIFTHMKLFLATGTHNSKLVKITKYQIFANLHV